MASQSSTPSSQGAQARKRPLSEITPHEQPEEQEVYKSKEITDRASTFVGAFSPTASPRALQSLPAFRSASHRILAWRQRARNQQRTLTGPPRVLYDAAYDDDGEKYGGKHAERVLEEMKVEGAVVVARWYGGVLLGPVRFSHIESCAREAVTTWQAAQRNGGGQADGSLAKKPRLGAAEEEEEEEDSRSRDELVKVLAERDESVKILRGLLAEKLGKTAADSSPKASQPPKYEAMPIVALRRLEKARDSTLTWILKEIDRAEEAKKGKHDLENPSKLDQK